MPNNTKKTLKEVQAETQAILAANALKSEQKDKEREAMMAEKIRKEKEEKQKIEEIKDQQEFLERTTLADVINKNQREVERAFNLDETSIVDKLAETFCYPPDKTIKDMTDEEIVKHITNLTEMISIIRTHVHTTEREMHENKLRDKKLLAAETKKYVSKNEPTVTSNQLNKIEKELWKIAHDNISDEDEARDCYNAMKIVWKKDGMKGVQRYMDENFD